MPDYKEMYLRLFWASEQAMNLLMAAQRECEEFYINAPEPKLTLVKPENAGSMQEGE